MPLRGMGANVVKAPPRTRGPTWRRRRARSAGRCAASTGAFGARRVRSGAGSTKWAWRAPASGAGTPRARPRTGRPSGRTQPVRPERRIAQRPRVEARLKFLKRKGEVQDDLVLMRDGDAAATPANPPTRIAPDARPAPAASRHSRHPVRVTPSSAHMPSARTTQPTLALLRKPTRRVKRSRLVRHAAASGQPGRRSHNSGAGSPTPSGRALFRLSPSERLRPEIDHAQRSKLDTRTSETRPLSTSLRGGAGESLSKVARHRRCV